MHVQWICLAFLFMGCISWAEESTLFSLKPIPGMERADLYYVKTVPTPKAVLVLSPGCNGNGKELVENPIWQSFAKQQNLVLIGLSFASAAKDLHNGTGYYYVENGSGKLLLDGINKLFNSDLPILLYGFSGGAHFTSRFVEWKPERVISWCAYSAGWWDEPKKSDIMPPGIVACGENDERLGASLIYFKQGRAVGKPWLWIGIPYNGHSQNEKVDLFIREYFAAILKNGEKSEPIRTGLWVDIDKRNIAEAHVQQYPTVTAWLPDVKLLDMWSSLNRGLSR